MGSSHSGVFSLPLVRVRHCRHFLGTAAAWKFLQLLRHECIALIPAPTAYSSMGVPSDPDSHKGGNKSLDFACLVAPKLECSPGCAGWVCPPVTTIRALPESKPGDWVGYLGQRGSRLPAVPEQILWESRCPRPCGCADFSICKESHIVFPGSRKMHPSAPSNICHCERALSCAKSALPRGIFAAEAITEEVLRNTQNFSH